MNDWSVRVMVYITLAAIMGIAVVAFVIGRLM